MAVVLEARIIAHELLGRTRDAAEGSAQVGGRHRRNLESIRRSVQSARLVLLAAQ